MTTTTTIDVTEVPRIDWPEAGAVAAEEYARTLRLVDTITGDEWSRQTPCTDWDVRDMAGHLVGSWRQYASTVEAGRQMVRSMVRARRSGRDQVDEWTAAQVEDTAHLTVEQVRDELRTLAPKAVRGRRRVPRVAGLYKVDDGLGNELSLHDLMRVVATRDCWMHRDDLRRALDRPHEVDTAHDGRIVADVVRDWAERHGLPFTLHLTGPAGGRWRQGTGGETLELDALDFCRSLAGRREAPGMLAHGAPF